MAELVLNVQDIDETGKDYDFPVTHAWLTTVLVDTDVSPRHGEPEGHLSLHAHKQGVDVVLVGRLRASLTTPCARCLEDAVVEVDAELGALITARAPEPKPGKSGKPGPKKHEKLRPVPDALELTPEDLVRDFYTGDTIVLDDVVREHLLLEVPIQPLCGEDCPGIPVPTAVSGPADLSRDPSAPGVDPRLAPLMNLVGKLKPTEE
jgi:uncharacterized protein